MNTDNSKVNTNLLKENEALKERIKKLEEENVIIPIWQFKEIEDALRLTYTINKCQLKVTAFDRLVCKAWNFAKIALNPKT
jgi:hypothetical protein